MNVSSKVSTVDQVKPVQKLSVEAMKMLASAKNNGSGGHCQGGGDGNW